MFGRSCHHLARAEESAGFPCLFLWSFFLSRLDLKKKKHHVGSVLLPFGFGQKLRRDVISPRSHRRKRHVRPPSGDHVLVGKFAPSFLSHG